MVQQCECPDAEAPSGLLSHTLMTLCDSVTFGVRPSHFPSTLNTRPVVVLQLTSKNCSPGMGGWKVASSLMLCLGSTRP